MTEPIPIRKRSQIARAAVKADEADRKSLEEKQYTGTDCSVCGRPQFEVPSGVVCAAGHGGAPSKEETKVEAMRAKGDVVRASRALEEAMRESEGKEEDVSPNFTVRRSGFPDKESAIPPTVDRIIEKQFIQDIEGTYDKLERSLKLAEERGERGHLENALDEAETHARLAFRLLVTVKVEKRRWELENAPVWAAARKEATSALEQEKKAGTRTKQITDADVEAMAAQLHPDEHRAQHVRVYKFEQMVKSIEHLADVWLLRVKTLQSLYGRQR